MQFLKDQLEVLRRGWGLIVGSGLLSGLGAFSQARGLLLPRHGGWHWPSPWWGLGLLGGWLMAQTLVIRDRGRELERMREEQDTAVSMVGPSLIQMGGNASLIGPSIRNNMVIGRIAPSSPPLAMASQNAFTNAVVRIADLVTSGNGEVPVVRAKQFIGCSLVGPAWVYMDPSNQMRSNVFMCPDHRVELIRWETDREVLVGVIAFEDCVIRGCEFYEVGFVGPPDLLSAILPPYSDRPELPPGGAQTHRL
jgi:hypothetical protein